MNEEIILELGSMFPSEVDNLQDELKRIKEKHGTEGNECFYDIVVMYPAEEGSSFIVMKANKKMLAAFVIEQMT